MFNNEGIWANNSIISRANNSIIRLIVAMSLTMSPIMRLIIGLIVFFIKNAGRLIVALSARGLDQPPASTLGGKASYQTKDTTTRAKNRQRGCALHPTGLNRERRCALHPDSPPPRRRVRDKSDNVVSPAPSECHSHLWRRVTTISGEVYSASE